MKFQLKRAIFLLYMHLFKNYGLSITLAVLFLTTWVGQGFFQWQQFTNHQEQHNQPVMVEEFVPEFLSSTFENWQSEFLQLLTFVLLTSFLVHKGSHESKDSDEEMKAMLQKIDRKLSVSKKK